MSTHVARRPAPRRRRRSPGLGAILALDIVAALAMAVCAIPTAAGAPDARVHALPGQRVVAASDEVARDLAAKTRPYRIQEGYDFKLRPEILLARQRALLHPAVFRVSTFNVLGAGHTAKGGDRQGWASGATRMRWAVDLLRGAGIDVVGFQEFQSPQLAVFRRSMPHWGVYPAGALRRGSMANSIAWDEGEWELVETRHIDIPYFGGKPVQMPYVRLRDRVSGQDVWFANFHNPADAHGPAQRFRDRARSLEINLANRLRAGGTPVIITGDMNDREEYFCPMTAQAPMHAANGGSTGGGCAPPAHMDVDWIFGSTDVDFANFVSDKSRFVGKTTDHPFVWADATLH